MGESESARDAERGSDIRSGRAESREYSRRAYQRVQIVTSTTLLVKTEGLVDVFAVAEQQEDFLLDIFEHEVEAADLWHRRRQRNQWWNEGLVRLRYQETELIEASLVDDVYALWSYLLNLVEEFLEAGRAESSFPDKTTPIVMETRKGRVFFSVDTTRVMIEPAAFISSLVNEAERFFDWIQRNLGEYVPSAQIAGIRERLAR